MIPILLVTSKHHSPEPVKHMPSSLSPLGLIRVLTLSTSASGGFFTACWIGCLLALTPAVDTRVVWPSVFFTADSVVRGSLTMAQWSSLFLLGALSEDV